MSKASKLSRALVATACGLALVGWVVALGGVGKGNKICEDNLKQLGANTSICGRLLQYEWVGTRVASAGFDTRIQGTALVTDSNGMTHGSLLWGSSCPSCRSSTGVTAKLGYPTMTWLPRVLCVPCMIWLR